ncbi:hypothetical protein LZ31DRAFT_342927 [Colletotrichum somersetense]|nr:hypothetical protein LZ31DRAFT_342927 [Colletotrichum somersetense]
MARFPPGDQLSVPTFPQALGLFSCFLVSPRTPSPGSCVDAISQGSSKDSRRRQRGTGLLRRSGASQSSLDEAGKSGVLERRERERDSRVSGTNAAAQWHDSRHYKESLLRC